MFCPHNLGQFNPNGAFLNYTASEDWQRGYLDISKIPDTPKLMPGFGFDPTQDQNVDFPAGTDYYLQYVAFTATEEEAQLESQRAPKGLEIQPGATLDQPTLITGVNSDMEYRTGYSDWTKVEGDSITADPGATYAIRYAKKDGFNVGYAATITVPVYWDLDISGIMANGMPVMDAKITSDDIRNWNIELPYGTDPAYVVLDYKISSQASPTYNRAATAGGSTYSRSIYLSADTHTLSNSGAEPAKLTALDVSSYVESGEPMELDVYSAYAILDHINITWSVAEQGSDNAAALVEKLEARDFTATGIRFESGAKAYVESYLATIKVANPGYTFTVNGAGYTAASSDSDGSYKFTVAVTGSDSAATKELTLTIKYAEAPYIVNFGSPLVTNQTNFVAYSESQTPVDKSQTFIEEPGHLGAGYTEFVRAANQPDDAKSTEFNVRIYPGNSSYPIYPEISDLSKYQYVLLKYKAPGHTSNQLYYYTDANTGNPYLNYTPVASVDDWNYHLYRVSDVLVTGKWTGKVENLRFDFFRAAYGTEATLDLELIGLFETLEQAQTFAMAPELDSEATAEQLAETYAAELEKLKTETPYIYEGEDVVQAVRDYVSNLCTDAYPYEISSSDGKVTFKVAFTESPVNGNYVLSDTITAEIIKIEGESTVTEQRASGELRFKTTLQKSWMEKLADEGTEVTYGTYVVPKKLLNGATLDAAAVANAEYCVADVPGVNIFEDADDTLTYTAVVTGIPENFFGEIITARAYVKFTHNGKQCTVLLGDILENSFNGAGN